MTLWHNYFVSRKHCPCLKLLFQLHLLLVSSIQQIPWVQSSVLGNRDKEKKNTATVCRVHSLVEKLEEWQCGSLRAVRDIPPVTLSLLKQLCTFLPSCLSSHRILIQNVFSHHCIIPRNQFWRQFKRLNCQWFHLQPQHMHKHTSSYWNKGPCPLHLKCMIYSSKKLSSQVKIRI